MPRRRIPVPRAVENALGSVLDTALDKALTVQRPVVLAHLARVRRRHPHETPAQITQRLERQYLAAVVGVGGASGAAAAVPGVGTMASVASAAGEVTAFVSATAMYVLALAELHGLPVSDPEVRRALVLAVLVGGGEGATVAELEATGAHGAGWAQVLTRGSAADKERIGALNGRLGRLVVRRLGTKQGALLMGRALPLGIGAAVGAGGNAALGRKSVAAARRAFGPPPERFAPRVVDA